MPTARKVEESSGVRLQGPRERVERRYRHEGVLGVGGMAEVFEAFDARLQRTVAVKAPRSDVGADLSARFTRECRVQALLEHPGIVPVYDAGRLPDGSPYFAMKRVHGRTLEAVLEDRRLQRAHAPDPSGQWRLAVSFLSICRTVAYAHSRGVIHRDIKPANVIIGDFGEVYVLDWGVARLVDAKGLELDSHGALLGTLGYMAPEQVTANADVGPAADIYALGAMLFEIATSKKLHDADRSFDVIASTLASTEPKIQAAARRGDLSPTLERICVIATALDPATRYPSAAALIEDIERFLDRSRDDETRLKIAAREAQSALRALSQNVARPEEGTRAALRHAGRALALSPSEPLAHEVVEELTRPTFDDENVPAEVIVELDREASLNYRRFAKVGALLLSLWLPFLAGLWLTDVRAPWVLGLWTASVATAVGALFIASRIEKRSVVPHFVSLVACLMVQVLSTRALGPYGPSWPATIIVAVLFMVVGKHEWRAPTVALGAAALFGPGLFEELGILSRTTTFFSDGFIVRASLVHFHPRIAPLVLLLGAALVYAPLVVGASQLRMEIVRLATGSARQRWKLASLFPESDRRPRE